MLLRNLSPLLLIALLLSACGLPDSQLAAPSPSSAPASTTADCAAAFVVPTIDPALPSIASEPTMVPALPPTFTPYPEAALTLAPVATASPELAIEPPPTETITEVSVPYDHLRATAVARATLQPMPTAAALTIQAGEPFQAQTRRGDLILMVTLPATHFLAGEAAQVLLTLHNVGTETLIIGGDGRRMGWLHLQDERGAEPAPWPWPMPPMPGAPFFRPLAAGATLSTTLTLQTPPAGTTAHTYTLWAATRFARAIPGTEAADHIWLQLETGPIPLQLTVPRADQQLHATLSIDRSGYSMQVNNTNDQKVATAWGELNSSFLVAQQFESFTIQPLKPATGVWSGAWDAQMQPEQAQIITRAWIAAPGYVTTVLTQTLSSMPLTAADEARVFWGRQGPCRQRFTDAAALQHTFGIALVQLPQQSTNAMLEQIDVEVTPGWATITSHYQLTQGAWLDLTQLATTDQHVGRFLGEADMDPEAKQVVVGDAQGYLIQRYGVWLLEWTYGSAGLKLRAPVSALSEAALLQIAAQATTVP